MIIPDTNLLIYAYDQGASHHKAAKALWESSLTGQEPAGIPWIVAMAFTRLMTHPTLSENPMSVNQASSILREWLEMPVCRLLPATEETFDHFLHSFPIPRLE